MRLLGTIFALILVLAGAALAAPQGALAAAGCDAAMHMPENEPCTPHEGAPSMAECAQPLMCAPTSAVDLESHALLAAPLGQAAPAIFATDHHLAASTPGDGPRRPPKS
ncbi:hypothetical protein OEZ60_11330 [Defluviimonas sp. WL0024]|uniref:Uncharacterized protein n=1 Tax=Albidovulum salinarum TaxID=2984153 RepID=A0ABT2X3T9_9RHOB|nr:hypothetical protein [Defluviimonas sp. WL0024]MCU9848603.1 hypothetical protein [Defluviimonas sp. WL0024]